MPLTSQNAIRANLLRFPTLATRSSAIRTTVTKLNLVGTFPHEPEDAHLTGATRSLYRRLLALNLQPMRIQPARSATAGLPIGTRIA